MNEEQHARACESVHTCPQVGREPRRANSHEKYIAMAPNSSGLFTVGTFVLVMNMRDWRYRLIRAIAIRG